MSKIITALVAAAALAAALTATACTPDTPDPTGCVVQVPDAGVVSNETCAIAWTCSSDSQFFQLVCSASQGNYSCVCTSNLNTNTQTIVVPPFVCQDLTSRPVAGGCGFSINN